MYGSETWSTTKKDEQLQIFEDKILRRIFGPIKDTNSGEWRARKNTELYSLFKSQRIINVLKLNRLHWLGHVERMKENRQIKLMYAQEMRETRPRGRPRQRWKDNIEEDIKEIGVTNWREKIRDREEWRRTLSAAMSLNGSES